MTISDKRELLIEFAKFEFYNAPAKTYGSIDGRKLNIESFLASIEQDKETEVCTDKAHVVDPGGNRCSVCGTPYIHGVK